MAMGNMSDISTLVGTYLGSHGDIQYTRTHTHTHSHMHTNYFILLKMLLIKHTIN